MRTRVLKQAVMQRTSAPSNESPMNLEMRCAHFQQTRNAEPESRPTATTPCHELIASRLNQVQGLHDLFRDGERRILERANLSNMT